MLYVIRQISTGWFLPYPRGRNGRGGSWVEPEPCHNKRVRALCKRGANTCLARWLEGRWVGDADGDTWVNKVYGRDKSDMEIVPVEMMESAKGFGPIYLIRHKVTGKYLPTDRYIHDEDGHCYRGVSWVECTEPDKEKSRGFKSYLAARRFLVPWLRGKTEFYTTYKNSFEEHEKLIPGTRRHEADYEIVLFTFKVI